MLDFCIVGGGGFQSSKGEKLDLLHFQVFGNGGRADIVWTSQIVGCEIGPFSILVADFDHCSPNYTVPLLVGMDFTNIVVATIG